MLKGGTVISSIHFADESREYVRGFNSGLLRRDQDCPRKVVRPVTIGKHQRKGWSRPEIEHRAVRCDW
ncbi:hypothetical protein KCU89_g49, partial [Aureobasidium melanogenum]